MKNKYFILFLVCLLCLGSGFYWFSSGLLSGSRHFNPECAFCKEKIRNQLIFEGHLVEVLLNYKPLLEGHSLIIPKRHVERFEDLSPEELVEIGEAIQIMHKVFIKAYGVNDYLLVLQNGLNAGQTVSHTHFHMLPRGPENALWIKVKLWQTILTEVIGLRKPLSPEELLKQTTMLHQTYNEVSTTQP